MSAALLLTLENCLQCLAGNTFIFCLGLGIISCLFTWLYIYFPKGGGRKRKKSCAILELFAASIFGGNQTQITAERWHASSKGVFTQHFIVSITSQSLKVKCLKGSSSQDKLSSYLTVITPDISVVLYYIFLKESCSLGFTCRNRISWQVELKYSYYAARNVVVFFLILEVLIIYILLPWNLYWQ